MFTNQAPIFCSIQLSDLVIPTSSLTSSMKDLTIQASDISIHITADWQYRENDWYSTIQFVLQGARARSPLTNPCDSNMLWIPLHHLGPEYSLMVI